MNLNFPEWIVHRPIGGRTVENDSTRAISVLDGRDSEYLGSFGWSEHSLILCRASVMIGHILSLDSCGFAKKYYINGALTNIARAKLSELIQDPDSFVDSVKRHEQTTQHDLKACELAIRDLMIDSGLVDYVGLLHLGLTSEDVNNLAYNKMCTQIRNYWYDSASSLVNTIHVFDATGIITARTHGQPACPIKLKKRFLEFASRLRDIILGADSIKFSGKMGGAVGGHHAFNAIAPDFDVWRYSSDFVKELEYEYTPWTNQRNNHISVSRWMNELGIWCNVAADICQNIWLMVSDGTLQQRVPINTAGSSTLVQKVNPWKIENARANFEIAAGMIPTFCRGVLCSQHERDLSDHQHERTIGTIVGYICIGNTYLTNGISELSESKIQQEIHDKSIVSEALLTALKLENFPDPYGTIKGMIRRGEAWESLVDKIKNPELKSRIAGILEKPETYIGTFPHQLELPTAIVFDLDNTLIDTNGFIRSTIGEVLTKLRLVVYPEFEEHVNGLLAQNIRSFETLIERVFEKYAQKLETPVDFLAVYREIAKTRKMAPVPHGVEVISRLHMRMYRLAVLTNRVSMAQERLEQAGYDLSILKILPSKVPKPEPGCMDPILERFKDSKEIWYIGDHITDYQGSQSVGDYCPSRVVKFIGVGNGEFPPEVKTVSGLSELLFMFD